MWLEENIGRRINLERTDEALGTGAGVVSTACPFCLIMLDDAVKQRQREDEVSVLDVAQILERSTEAVVAAAGKEGEPGVEGGPAIGTAPEGEAPAQS